MSFLLKKVKLLYANPVFKNTFYLGTIQVVNYLFPLLTIPFLIRVLGVSNFGLISLSQLTVTYLCVIVDYGFNLSATREISINVDDKRKVDAVFSNVISIKALMATLVVIISIILISNLNIGKIDKLVYLASLSYLIGEVLFPIWFFQGVQNMKSVAVFYAIAKIVTTIPMFIFIRSPNDVVLAAVFYGMGSITSGLIGFLYAKFHYKIKFGKISLSMIKKMYKDGFDIFLPTLFTTIFTNGGLIILGFFHSHSAVGIFSSIDKLVKAGIGLLSTVTQSLFPNISKKFSVDKKQAIHTLVRIGKVVMLVLIFISMLVFVIAKPLLVSLYGKTYEDYYYILNFLMVWTWFAFLNNFIGIQFLVASGNSKYYRKSFLSSGLIVLISFIGIRYLGINGILLSLYLGEIALTLFIFYNIFKNNLYAD